MTARLKRSTRALIVVPSGRGGIVERNESDSVMLSPTLMNTPGWLPIACPAAYMPWSRAFIAASIVGRIGQRRGSGGRATGATVEEGEDGVAADGRLDDGMAPLPGPGASGTGCGTPSRLLAPALQVMLAVVESVSAASA